MQVFLGRGVNGGIAIGRLYIFKKEDKIVEYHQVKDATLEINRYEKAKEKTIENINVMYEKTKQEIGEEEAMIFDAHRMMVEDPQFSQSVIGLIQSQLINAEAAIDQTARQFIEIFSSMEDEYMRARAADIADVSKKLIESLKDEAVAGITLTEPSIILTSDLMPSETVSLDKAKVLGFILQKGSMNSHTSILARTMGVPAMIDTTMDLNPSYDGKLVILDGIEGKVYLDPDSVTLRLLQEKQLVYRKHQELLNELKGKESVTIDGKKVSIYANIGQPEDVDLVLDNDAEGIGLFRSEFLYLGKKDYPTEEEQFQTYKVAVERMQGKKVIIRTLDIGADKKVDYFNLEEEENPAMGFRAIRICLARRDLFKTQLRAIYRASVYGTVAIMFPMIISLEELLEIKEIMRIVRIELTEEGIPFKELETGIMIETPAAVMISDLLAKEVDFFSIGTNDLTQYTLAIDRQNQSLEGFYNPCHIAVLRMIRLVTQNAHARGIWVGICGELAADISMTESFLHMGIDELSVAPGKVLELRKRIREINLNIKY